MLPGNHEQNVRLMMSRIIGQPRQVVHGSMKKLTALF